MHLRKPDDQAEEYDRNDVGQQEGHQLSHFDPPQIAECAPAHFKLMDRGAWPRRFAVRLRNLNQFKAGVLRQIK